MSTQRKQEANNFAKTAFNVGGILIVVELKKSWILGSIYTFLEVISINK